MKDMHPDILELLVLRATEGLSSEQREQLEEMLREDGLEDTEEMDLAAAAAANAFALKHVRDSEDAPDNLKSRLREDAERFFADKDDNVVELRSPQATRGRWNWGWATAAALAVALIATNRMDIDSGTVDHASARQQLIAATEGTRIIPWAAPESAEFAGVTGDVVWNDERQEGYMLLTGMPVNDPTRAQYQLWLVDPDRDSNPVDGGVFDIPPGEETVVVPINAKLAVSNPTVFAITREKPGGVVVSRGPLLVVAAAS